MQLFFQIIHRYFRQVLIVFLLTVGAMTLISRVAADAEDLGPATLIEGEYINTNQPTFEFVLTEHGAGEPLSFRIEIANGPVFEGGENDLVVQYDSAENKEDGELYEFQVGQEAESGGTYSIGEPEQELVDGPYYWRVRSADSEGTPSPFATANSGNVAFIVDTTAPNGPTSLDSSSHTVSVWSNDNDVEVSWTAATDGGSGLAGYSIVFNTDEDAEPDDSIDLDENAITTSFEGLTSGEYYFHIKAVDAVGNWGETVQFGPFLIDNQPPIGPTGVTATDHTVSTWSTENVVALTWTPATDFGDSGLAGYASVFDTSAGTNPTVQNLTDAATGVSSSSLSDDNTHYFHIRAIDNAGNMGATTHVGPFFIDATDPDPVPGIPTTTSPTNDATPEWTWAAADDATSGLVTPAYTVEWSQDPGMAGSQTATTNATSFEHEDALASGTWYFRVTATDLAGNTATSPEDGEVVIDTAGPDITVGPEHSVTTTTATIEWETDKPATSMVLYGFGSNLDEEESTSGLVEEHSITVENLVSCTTYSYAVRSVDEATNQTTSDTFSFTTAGCLGEVIDQAEEEISEEDGGTVELTSGGQTILLDVHPDSLDADTVFQIKRLDANDVDEDIGRPAGVIWAGNNAYSLQAFTDAETLVTTFDPPISITITFSAGAVAGIDLSTLVIYRWDGTSWIPLDNCVVDEGSNSITCETSNFSVFGLFGEGLPEPTPTPPPSGSGSSSRSSRPAAASAPTCSDDRPVGAPSLFQIDTMGTQATLYYVPVSGPVNTYAVVYGHEPGTEQFGVEFEQGSSDGVLSYTINELSPNTVYYFTLRAGNGCMPGDWSNEMQARTGAKGSTSVTKFYKDFVHQVVGTLPKQISSLTPVPTSDQATDTQLPSAGGQPIVVNTPAPATPVATPPSVDNNTSESGLWTKLRSLFGW